MPAVFTNQNKSETSYSNQIATLVGTVFSTAGLYKGFGCFTYTSNEVLVPGGAVSYINQSKSSTTYSNQAKN